MFHAVNVAVGCMCHVNSGPGLGLGVIKALLAFLRLVQVQSRPQMPVSLAILCTEPLALMRQAPSESCAIRLVWGILDIHRELGILVALLPVSEWLVIRYQY